MMGPEKITKVMVLCAMLHNVALGHNIPLIPGEKGHSPYAVVAPMEQVRDATLHQHGIMVWDDFHEYFM